MFPIGDDQVQGGSRPFFAYIFIAINIAVFLFQVSLSPDQLNVFVNHYGTIPSEINHGQDLYTIFTSMFLHGGWMHLIGNMLFMWVFADNIEAVMGNFNFLIFYLLGGIAAALVNSWISGNSDVPAIGASGAISAVLGAYIVMFPASKVKILVLYWFSSFYISAIYFLGFWIVQQLVSGFFSLGNQASQSQSSGVAFWAHIGGFGFGLVTGFVARRMIEKKPSDRPGDYV